MAQAVTVTFVDEATGTEIAVSEVPLDQLPDSFALETELQMGGVSYVVVGAEPREKADFARSGRLAVTLRQIEQMSLPRIERVDPGQLLYSLPSICAAALPAIETGPLPVDVVMLHEDDWRQCELVARDLHREISAELGAIRRIHTEATASVGWREIHARDRIARPLPPGLTWEDVKGRIGPHEPLGGVTFGGADGPVRGAVGARLPGRVVLWGVEQGGALAVLCVERIETAAESSVAALKRVADALNLALVHWCRCQVYAPGLEIAHTAGEPW